MGIRTGVLAAATIALLLTGCGKTDRETVHVYNWSDYISDEVVKRFEQQTGIRVVYDVYDANEILEAKLLAGRSGYDVIFPTAHPFAERHIQAGLYLALDPDLLPNRVNLEPSLMRKLEAVDPGNRFTVPYMWGTTGIGYNVAQVAAALGEEAEVDSWSLIFDPEIAEKLSSCGIAVLDDEGEALAAALLYLGKDPNTTDPADIEEAANLFMQVRPFIRYFHASRYINDLANGDICVAHGYSGDVIQARDRAEEVGRGVEVDYVIPREGAVLWFDLMAIPADAPNPGNAHAFINFLMQPENIALITNEVAYANANRAATALVDEEIRNDPGVYPTDEIRERLVTLQSLPDEVQRHRVRTWTQIKTGR
ncbi:polyamine ABC transporter substrate-binding protein [Thioalkalivibrio sulfidiphilus]|uniref:polyamine ABC transporter substrate-binding protein n=1 Tax=Thioalkalivibrio sulfidiphilus TaxID=1033854 RepID=UPI0003A6F73B|nr:polyamine ABC transporter substrate-binding protein [Thioalkalivibrio sulfidiphilus]